MVKRTGKAGRPKTLTRELERAVRRAYRQTGSLTAAARLLNEQGIAGAQGGRWHPVSVRRIVQGNYVDKSRAKSGA